MSDAAAPTMLRPGDVAALGLWLRGAGMEIHPSQIIAATRLLTGARRPPPVADLAPWLAPVFCTNTAEQEAFRALYADWLKGHGISGANDDADDHDDDDTAGNGERSTPYLKRPRRWPVIMLSCVLIAVACAFAFIPRQPPPETHTPVTTATDPTENLSAGGIADMERIDLLAAPAAMQVPAERKEADALPGLARRIGGVLILCGVAAWWVYSAARRRGFLERLPSDDRSTRRRLAMSATPALAAYSSALRYLGRELRRRCVTPSRRLDIRATLAATVQAGGLPRPLFGSLGEPVYLVLVERASAADHQAALGEEVVHMLHGQGVAVERYEFDGDPRFSRHAPLEGAPRHEGTQSLDALLARHPDAHLIIFSDGNGLIDQYTGMPAAWIGGLLEWPGPVLITPQPDQLWARREWLLAQAGLTILPLDGNGLRGLGRFLREHASWGGMHRAARARTRPAYLRDVDLLLDRRPPDEETLKLVMHELERDLGPTGLAWLAACAVYPEIHWAISLAVGDSIAPFARRGQQYARDLAQISRLPWMRMGYMPDWFRTALLVRLTPESERKVRAALDDFLASLSASTRPHGAAIEIAIEPRRRAWNDVVAGLRAWRRRQTQMDKREDAIFLQFMNGPSKPLTVAASRVLMRLLYRDGVPLGGPRPWLPLAALLLVAATSLVPLTTSVEDAIPTREVLPAPTAIALDTSGERIAVINDAGGLAEKAVKKRGDDADTPTCHVTTAGGEPLWIGVDGVVVFGRAGRNGVSSGQVSGKCVGEVAAVPPFQMVVGGPTGRLSTAPLAPADLHSSAVLCTRAHAGRVFIAQRNTIDAALPRAAGPAVACAFTEDASSLLVAARTGALVEYPLTDAGTAPRIDRAALPDSIGGGYSIATNNLRDIAVVATSGKVFLKQEYEGWRSLDVQDARPPLALSAHGHTLAFTTAQRAVAVWQTRPPTVPADPGNASSSVGYASSPRTSLPPVTNSPTPEPVTQLNSTPPEITEYSEPGSLKVKFITNLPFKFDSAVVQDKGTLEKLLAKLRDVDIEEVVITGHTAQTGSQEYNQSLSLRLASSVAQYLSMRGIPPNLMTTIGGGETKRTLDEDFSSGVKKQLTGPRAEIVVTGVRKQVAKGAAVPVENQSDLTVPQSQLQRYPQEVIEQSRPPERERER